MNNFRKIRTIKRNIAIVNQLGSFWGSGVFRLIYRHILKHRFSSYDVSFRYAMLNERKIQKLKQSLKIM